MSKKLNHCFKKKQKIYPGANVTKMIILEEKVRNRVRDAEF